MKKGIQFYLSYNPGGNDQANEESLKKWSRVVEFVQEEFVNFSNALSVSFGLGLTLAVLLFMISLLSVLLNYRWRVL